MNRSSNSDWILRGGVLLALLVIGWTAGTLVRSPKANAWPAKQSSKPRIRVLTTIFPVYDFTREIGGPDVEVRNLLPPGVDPHEFALSPRDIELVDGADLLIANGGGLDHFLTEAIQKASLKPKLSPTICSKGLQMLAGHEEPGHEKHAGEEEESGDPHLWLDPVFARHYAAVIADSLSREMERRGDLESAARIRSRFADFDRRLVALDSEYRARLSNVQVRSFIAFHGAFAYLAARYGLGPVGVWQTTPGRDPGPREVGELLKLAKKGSARALFSEPQFSPRALEMIARDAHLPVYSLDPMETALSFDDKHYIPVMQANLKTLAKALGGGQAK